MQSCWLCEHNVQGAVKNTELATIHYASTSVSARVDGLCDAAPNQPSCCTQSSIDSKFVSVESTGLRPQLSSGVWLFAQTCPASLYHRCLTTIVRSRQVQSVHLCSLWPVDSIQFFQGLNLKKSTISHGQNVVAWALPCPLLGVICHLYAWTCYDQSLCRFLSSPIMATQKAMKSV